MAARFPLPSLRGIMISRARWIAIALATGGECIDYNMCCVYQARKTSNLCPAPYSCRVRGRGHAQMA